MTTAEAASKEAGTDAAVAPVKRRNRQPEFTRRDREALLWLGEQYGARLDILGVLLGRLADSAPLSRSGVRNQIERWKRSGLVTATQMLGETWVTPTRAGYERVELPFVPWAVPATRVRHVHAVNVVRLWWESQPAAEASPWISERWCYAERGKGPTWHIPDGKILDPSTVDSGGPDQFIGIEVELMHKTRKAYETEVFAKLQGGTAGVMYFVPDEAFASRLRTNIDAVLQRRGSNVRYSIKPLPEVPGTTYRGNW